MSLNMEDSAVRLQRNLTKFIQHVDALQLEDDPAGNGYNREYRVLREEAQQAKAGNTYPATVGREPYNIRKNRYKDIIAYDDTRVLLQEIEGVEGSDYINANFVQNSNGHDGYIASQGPLPNTVTDFWRMLLQYQVKCVIMVCREMEGGKKKCAPYWPECVGEDMDFGNITVTMESEHSLADDCAVRCLKASDGSVIHTLTQYHYTGWPDHGIPEDIDVILAMLANMRDIRSRDSGNAPVVVHCSAGCGRTGTVCAIDYAWDILKSGKLRDDFSLFEIVRDMRTQRQSMIQTPDQYQLAHEAVKQLFEKHLSVMEDNIYANYGTDEVEDSEAMLSSGNGPSKKPMDDDDDDDIYSMASAQKILENEAMKTVNIYTGTEMEHETHVPKPKPRAPDKPKPSIVHPKPQTVKDDKPSYENVLVTERYENIDVRDSAENSKNKKAKNSSDARRSLSKSPRGSPKLDRTVKNNRDSGPVFQSASKSEGRSVFISSDCKNEDPANDGPIFVSSIGKKEGPVFSSQQFSKELGEKVNLKRSSPGSHPKKKHVDDLRKAEHTHEHSGPVIASNQSQPKSKTQPSASNASSGKFVTKISIGGSFEQEGSAVSYHDDRQLNHSENANGGTSRSTEQSGYYSYASNPNNALSDGPVFASVNQQQGDIYAEVNKSRPVSKDPRPKSSKPVASNAGADLYSEISIGTSGQPYTADVKRMSYKQKSNPNASRYEEVVIGNPSDGLYSFAEPSQEPALPSRNYKENPTNTMSKSLTQPENSEDRGSYSLSRFVNAIKKTATGGSDQMNADSSMIPGYKQRLERKPSGPKEQPRWKKMFKSK